MLVRRKDDALLGLYGTRAQALGDEMLNTIAHLIDAGGSGGYGSKVGS